MANTLMPKRLELLSDLIPQILLVALLANPNDSASEPIIRDMRDAARTKGLQLHILEAGTEREIDAAFAVLVQLHAPGLVVGADAVFDSFREPLLALAARDTVPAIYFAREFVAAGGLISYGASFTGTWRQVGVYAEKVLKGTKPVDLPVEQPTKFGLVINLKTAKALGLTVPPSILARADEVIE